MRPAAVVLALLPLGALLRTSAPHRAPADPAIERVRPNDNRKPAGVLRGGVLTLRMTTRLGEWHPNGDSAPGAVLPTLTEEGHAPSIPGPLIRVPAGTDVVVTLRNSLDSTLTVYGLHDRVASARPAPVPIVIAPGETRTIRFRLDAPGTYYYYASTMGRDVLWRTREDSQLGGAIVVDAAGAPPARDRVFVIGIWSDTAGRALVQLHRMLAVINGRTWPNTERLTYDVGDTVHWRVLNPSADTHPMHLHGFYFRLDSHGDGRGDTTYAPSQRPMEFTDHLLPGGTMSLTWVPERAGNWLFHCHLPVHFEPRDALGIAPVAMNHAMAHGMSGLVLGVTVRDRGGNAPVVAAGSAEPRRRIRLLVAPERASSDSAPLFDVSLHERGVATLGDTTRRAAPTLVLTQGDPVAITVVNTLGEPTSVHWHGIELESYYDGVPGFSGAGQHLAPLVAPRDSFEVRFTPPRAGTFIYHTHVDEDRQQRAGLAGVIVVLPRGAAWDPSRDLVFLVTSPADVPTERRAVLVNGEGAPRPVELRAGTTYRLRFVNMTARRPGLGVAVSRDTTLMRWRPLAKDAADLAPERTVLGPARSTLSIGETADFELTPGAPGDLRLRMLAAVGPELAGVTLRVVAP